MVVGGGGGVRSDRRLRPIYGTMFLLVLMYPPPPIFFLFIYSKARTFRNIPGLPSMLIITRLYYSVDNHLIKR